MKIDLSQLSKENLITIIAQMHDTIQEWDNGYGYSQQDAKFLIDVGKACSEYCSNKGTWDFSTIKIGE